MSTFQTIDKVVDTVSEFKDGFDKGSKMSGIELSNSLGSISKAASKSIYYFPIIMSKNVLPSTMGMVSQNLEGSYMSFVKACFALTPAMNVKNSEIVNVEKYLEMFHQNIGLQTKDDLVVSLRESMEEYQMFPNDILNEANTSNVSGIINRYGSFGPSEISKTDKKGNPIIEKKYIQNKIAISEKEREINGFRPSVIEVGVTFIIGGQSVKINIPVGIKCVLHPVNPEDLLEYIMDSVSGKGLLHNIIRYTTGELHSLSDIIFGISNIKKNVAKNNDVTRWMKTIELRQKNAKKIRNNIAFLNKKSYLPNTSIVISMEDVNEIERATGYNLLTNPKRTVKFMTDNFLLSFVITDDVSETVYVLYDGHQDFQEFPYTTIKRENNKNEDIVNALIKGIGMGRSV